MRLKGSAKVLEQRRRKALGLLQENVSLHEVARRIGCHASSVMRWRDRSLAFGWRSFLGNRGGMREMLAFAQEKGIAPKVELMAMSRVNEAIQRLKKNEARYRIVLVGETR